ncbi:unnamed protein product [Paramecium sonneborni]|uniref:Transmembrane protein n=1 Tax=Paramecium sonneborni TaxID=65129 RepID=A0A8S1RAE2_9CILI|nr:unnamed protein product [Paramecium sonneborni]
MNFQFLVSAFFFDILFFNTKIYSQTEYYYQNETKFTFQQTYFVPFEQNLVDSNETQFNIELIHEIKVENQSTFIISEKQKLFYFQQITPENDNMIMVIDNSNLICLYLIKNYLLNQKLIITPHFCNNTLPYSSCNKIFQVNKEIFISNCQLNNNQIVISIINLNGQVFDEIKFDVELNCNIEFTYGYSYIFVYELNCLSDKIYQIEIDEKQFLLKSFQKLELNNITNSFQGQLVQTNICNKERIFFIYEKLILNYNLLLGKFNIHLYNANSIILNVFQICKGRQLIFDIETNSQQLRLDQDILNIRNQQFLNSMLIQKILVLHYNDSIVAMINDQLNQQIKIILPEIVPLAELGYFFGKCNSELRLFQIKPPKFYLQFNNSQEVLFLKFLNDASLYQFDLEYQKIEILSYNQSKLILKQQELIIYTKNNIDEICFEQSKITKSLPINLEAIKYNQRNYQITLSNIYDTCILKFENNSEIIYFGIQNNQTIIILLFRQENKIKIVFCQKKELIIQKSIKINTNIMIDYFILKVHNVLCIFYEQSIQIITLDTSFQTQIIEIKEHKILQVAKYFSQIKILFDNCKKTIFIYDQEQVYFNQISYPYPFDCTQTLQFIDDQLFFSQNEIFYSSQPNQRYILQEKIIQVIVDVRTNQYILVLEEGNEIIFKVFQIYKKEFIFVYKIPTYNFKCLPSSTIKFEYPYLMITAENSNKSFLLFYNLQNDAINALIYVTEIDQSQQFFQILDSVKDYAVYFKDDQFHIHKLNQICFNYSTQLQNNLFTNEKIELVISTFIHNLSTIINCQILRLHNDYSLNSFNEKVIYIFDENAFDWDKISGNIIKYEIQPIQDFLIKLPLNITQENFICYYYQSNFCIDYGNKFELLSFNIKDDLPFNSLEVDIKEILFNQESLIYTIFFTYQMKYKLQYFILQLEQIQLNKYKIIKKEIMQSVIPLSYVASIEQIKIINEIYLFQIYGYYHLLFHKNFCEIKGLFGKTSNEYYLIDGAYLSKSTYVFLYWKENNILASFIAFNNIEMVSELECNYDVIQNYEIDISQIFDRIFIESFETSIQKIDIFHLERIGDLYFLKFHMIFRNYFSLIFEISFDYFKHDKFKIQQYRFLRYEKNAFFLDLIYQDTDFVLLQFQLDLQRFINVYDIQGKLKNKDYLDSIQRIESQDFQKIEKYNATHFVIYGKRFEKIYLMTLNKLKIECQGLCNEPANLTLSNEVSSIILEIKLENKIVFTFKQRVILANILFIIIYIKFGKRLKRSQMQNRFNKISGNQ